MTYNAEQWHFIGIAFRNGVIFWVVMVAYAAVHDLFVASMSHTDQSFMPGASLSLSRIVYTIHWKRNRFGHKYRDRNILTVVDVLRAALNVIACVVYVVGTYQRTVFGPVRGVNVVLALIFLIDVWVDVTLADSALRDAVSLRMICEALSIPSLFYASGHLAYLNLGFLRAYVGHCNYCSINKRLGLSYISSYHFSALLFVKSLTLVYILASGAQLFEIPGDILSPTVVATWTNENDWHFFNSFYFTVVTLTTVGYGDISPDTLLGRVFTICMILLGIIVFSNIIGQIVEHVRYKRGSGAFVKRANSRHVILSGRPQLADIVRFTSEFYAHSRLSSATAKVVVLVPNPTWTDEEWSREVTRNEFLQRRVSFLVGNARNREDLRRVHVESADALFLVVSPFGIVDPSDIDAATVLDALAVRNVRTDIAIYSIVLLKASLFQVHEAQAIAVSNDPDLLFRKHMRGSAQHAGMLHDIFVMELNSVPRELQSHVTSKAKAIGIRIPVFDEKHREGSLQSLRAWVGSKISLQSREQVSVKSKEKPKGETNEDRGGSDAEQARYSRNDRKVFGRVLESCGDLGRSTAMCLQDINAALIAAHIKSNGVGTLITNMMLDIEVAVDPDEPAWLKEYQLGAVCHLLPLVIPYELHGVRITDVAVTLFDYGLVLLTLTSDPDSSSPDLILSPDKVLGAGCVGFFLTYHSRRFAYAALLLAALAFGGRKIRPEVDSTQVADFGCEQGTDSNRAGPSYRGSENTKTRTGRPDLPESLEAGLLGTRLTTRQASAFSKLEPCLESRAWDADAGIVRSAALMQATHQSEMPLSVGAAKVAVRNGGKVAKSEERTGPRENDEYKRSAHRLRSPKTQFYDSSEEEDDGVELSDSDSEGESKVDGANPSIRHDLRWLGASEFSYETARRDASGPQCPYCSMAGGSRQRGKQLAANMFITAGFVPSELKRHIILAGCGDLMLRQLPLLLNYIWRDSHRAFWRDRRYLYRGRIPVVVIHPCISDRIRLLFRKQEGKCLFFVEGSSSSRQTWKRAKLRAAKGVVVLADYADTWERADARTIFSTMALDSFIKDSQDVFIVSELIEEKSLQFLREPCRRRRIGVDEPWEDALYHGKRQRMFPNDVDNPTSPKSVNTEGTSLLAPDVVDGHVLTSQNDLGSTQQSHPVIANSQEERALVEEPTHIEKERATDSERKVGVTPLTYRVGLNTVRKHHSGFEEGTGTGPELRPTRRRSGAILGSALEGSRPDSMGAPSRFLDTAEDNGGDARPGVSRALRGTLFSRSGYASGDLLLRSAALNILVREYMEPGIAHLYKELVGAGSKRLGGLKIRLVRISRSIFDSGGKGTSSTGGSVVEYRAVVVQLVAMGATPLGLYRSGRAPVRIPLRSRLRRATEYERECVRIAKEQDHRHAGNSSVLEEGNEKMQTTEGLERTSACSTQMDGGAEALPSEVIPCSESSHSGGDEAEARGQVQSVIGEPAAEPEYLPKRAKEGDIDERWNPQSVVHKRLVEGCEYEEFREPDNRLPYVLTMPEPYSLVSECDGVYILCHPDFKLPLDWSEGYAQGLKNSESGVLV
jgi:hypothetical protein